MQSFATISVLVVIVDLFSNELSADKVLVDTVEAEEVIVSATLFHLTVLHDDDLIGVANGAQSVSHDDDRLLTRVDQLVKSLLYLVLTLGVQG